MGKLLYYCLYECTGLTSITIPNSVTSIGDYAFDGCSGLSSVTIPNSVTIIGQGAFSSCSSLTAIKVGTGNSKYDSRNNCNAIIETESNTLITGCKNTIIPNSVTSIGNSAFRSCSSLSSVTIPNSVTSIGDYAFRACSGLTSITIPNSVTSIGSVAFYGCSGLTTIKVETGNSKYDSRNNCNAIIETESNTLIAGCKNTIIPSNITSIEMWAFGGCSGLTSISIPNSVTSIGKSAFYDCSGLTSITIPNSVTSIGLYAFKGTGWYNNQPDGILYLDNCFLGYKGNSATGNLTLVDGTRLIAENALTGCTGLTSVTIPNSVTGIGDSAFSWCNGLTSVSIGNSVTNIGDYAFYGNYNIQTIACKAKTPPTCGTDVFKSVKVESVQLTVPKESVSLYQTADTWLDFCNITGAEFSGIEETIVDDVEGAEFYNLQGVKVENPERGLYIKRQGGKTSKVIL